MSEFPRITRDPKVMGGKPCIRGMRVTVGMIAGQISEGASIEALLEHFPYLERDDVLQAIGYAGALASDPKNSVADEGERDKLLGVQVIELELEN